MKIQLFKYWNRLRSSFWFVPAIMASLAVALVFVSNAVDEPATEWIESNLGWEITGEAEAASAVLGTIAGSMITIAGVVFSMTLVALSLASSQLGPRLLRNFMRDTSTQVVLGTFIATFLYCLLVLRSVRHEDEYAFVPNLSVYIGVALAVTSVGVFIYFIHHVSVSIQANEIAGRIGRELIKKVDQLFPDNMGKQGRRATTDPPDVGFIEAFDSEAQPVGSDGDGYLQNVDGDALLELATEKDLIIRLTQKPGSYVVSGYPLVFIRPGTRVNDELAKKIQPLFVMGVQRTADQDIEFGVNQLVEMAVRALSPGINDPFTAIACVDQLRSALCCLAPRDMPSPYRRDCNDQLRLISPANTFRELVDAAFNPIRQHGRSSAAVSIRLLDAIAVIAGFVRRAEDRATLFRHGEMITRGAKEGLSEEEDRRSVEERWKAVKASFAT